MNMRTEKKLNIWGLAFLLCGFLFLTTSIAFGNSVKFLKEVGLNDKIISITISPKDPFIIFTCSQSREIASYDVRTGSTLWKFQSRFINELVGLQLDQDRNTLAVSGARDGRVYVDFLDTKHSRLLKQIIEDVTPVTGSDGVTEHYGWFNIFNPVIEFSSGHRLFVLQTSYVNSDHEAIVKLYESESNREVFKLQADGGTLFTRFKFSSDGRLIYGAHRIGYYIWDAVSGRTLSSHNFEATKKDPNERSTTGAFSSDGRIVAFAFTNELTSRSTIRVFDAEKTNQICEASISTQANMMFSKTGRSILMVNKDGSYLKISAINCNEISSGSLGIWHGPGWNIPLNFLAISEDSRYLYSPYNPDTGEMDDIYVYELGD